MKRYGNLSGNSGVIAYETGNGWIAVKFDGGDVYRYTVRSAGAENIARMQRLAESGEGLSTFISRYVKDRYETKY